jgi:VCBS repeat-containing protein
MMPQAPDNNQGPWANMENFLRTLLTTNELYIVAGGAGTGGTGSNGSATTIANGHVSVPAQTWKVVLVIPKGEGDDASRVTCGTRTIAVIMPNTQGIRTTDWQTNYVVTVDQVEALTGYDFFSNLPDAVENCVEAGTNGVNPPGTTGQSVSTTEDTPVSITLEAASPNDNALTYTIVSGPAHGTLTGSGANREYTPNPGFNGMDSFTFKVNNGQNDSNISTVTITVFEVNDAPVAVDDDKSTAEDTALVFPASSLTTNDNAGAADESGQTLTVTSVNSSAVTHGTVTLNAGQVTYTPDANYHGPASFTYEVCDNGTTGGSLDSKCATATVKVMVESVNDAPVASGDAYATNSNVALNTPAPGVLSNDTDIDGDSLSAQLVSNVSHGTLTLNTDGSFVYTPATNFAGTDSFTYRAFDGTNNSGVATVNLTVNDTVGPTLNSSLAVTSLWSPNGKLFNVGLSASATDNGGGPVNVEVFVFSDEDDITLQDGSNSPDAKNIAPETLRLRAERDGGGNGRVYLIMVMATDSSGNTSRRCHTVVVPKSQSAASENSVNQQAQAAQAHCAATGTPPAGYFVVGDGPTVGSKQ